jgi:hypothetical protein
VTDDRNETPERADPAPATRASRAERLARQRAVTRNRILAVAGAVGIAALLAGAAVIAFGAEPERPRVLASPSVDTPRSVARKSSAGRQTNQAGETVSTPAFAKIRQMLIYLPVSPRALTAVMFHQSARGHSYDMTSLAPDADRAKVFRLVKGGAKLPIASSREVTSGAKTRDGERIVDGVWKGTVVRVLRMNRGGKPASAVDAGAKAGTVVVAPVSGTVTRVKAYKLYGRYSDYEIHVRPDAMTQADLVVIHVSDILVEPGDWVIGGVTPIARVRLLSNRMKHQLGEYTGEQGDHVHIQFNKPTATPDEAPSS